MKGADHVFAERVIDRGLATHGGVHLGQQGRRDLDKSCPALITGGDKTGQITDNPAAKRDDHAGAAVFALKQAADYPVKIFQVFGMLAIGQDKGVNLGAGQALADGLKVQRRDNFIGDDKNLLRGDMPREQCGIGKQALADVNRISAGAEFNTNLLHSVARRPVSAAGFVLRPNDRYG